MLLLILDDKVCTVPAVHPPLPPVGRPVDLVIIPASSRRLLGVIRSRAEDACRTNGRGGRPKRCGRLASVQRRVRRGVRPSDRFDSVLVRVVTGGSGISVNEGAPQQGRYVDWLVEQSMLNDASAAAGPACRPSAG